MRNVTQVSKCYLLVGQLIFRGFRFFFKSYHKVNIESLILCFIFIFIFLEKLLAYTLNNNKTLPYFRFDSYKHTIYACNIASGKRIIVKFDVTVILLAVRDITCVT